MRTVLIVLYTDQLEACRDFYASLGLDLVPERHGDGPEHYAAQTGGTVLELYPAGRRPATGYLRLGLAAPSGAGRPGRTPGRHTLTDPDGRTVVLTIAPEEPAMTATPQEARAAVARILGATAQTDVSEFPGGNLSLTITVEQHSVAIDGRPGSEWGWTIDPDAGEGFSGHDRTAQTLEDALNDVRSALTA